VDLDDLANSDILPLNLVEHVLLRRHIFKPNRILNLKHCNFFDGEATHNLAVVFFVVRSVSDEVFIYVFDHTDSNHERQWDHKHRHSSRVGDAWETLHDCQHQEVQVCELRELKKQVQGKERQEIVLRGHNGVVYVLFFGAPDLTGDHVVLINLKTSERALRVRYNTHH